MTQRGGSQRGVLAAVDPRLSPRTNSCLTPGPGEVELRRYEQCIAIRS